VELLRRTLVRTVMENATKRGVVYINEEEPMSKVLDTLTREDLLSMPILSSEVPATVVGFVDVLDIACFILDFYKLNATTIESAKTSPVQRAFFSAPIKKVLNYSGVDYPLTIREESNLLTAIQAFAHPILERRVHRLAVINFAGEIVGILSQSDILNFVSQYITFLPRSLAFSTVFDLNMHTPPITERLDTPFVETLEKLTKNRIHGIALFDHEFKLSTSFSVSDLRGLKGDSFDYFSGSTLQFLSRGTTSITRPVIYCHYMESFSDVILRMKQNHLHRIFTVDGQGHPVGIITLGNIIEKIVFSIGVVAV